LTYNILSVKNCYNYSYIRVVTLRLWQHCNCCWLSKSRLWPKSVSVLQRRCTRVHSKCGKLLSQEELQQNLEQHVKNFCCDSCW